MNLLILISLLSMTAINIQPVHSHCGGLDSSGCHNNRKEGSYHCHQSGSQPSARNSGLVSCPVTLLSVGDGDTIRIKDRTGTKITIRLACIDAPETSQGISGEWSTQMLKGMIESKPISLQPQVKDRYGRTVGEVYVGSTNINLQMASEGAAFAYRKYLKQCDQDAYLNAELTAKQNRKGVWGPYQTQLPWEFRRSRRTK
jgi:micrococcal nuclease